MLKTALDEKILEEAILDKIIQDTSRIFKNLERKKYIQDYLEFLLLFQIYLKSHTALHKCACFP